jgi:hypothetical protein
VEVCCVEECATRGSGNPGQRQTSYARWCTQQHKATNLLAGILSKDAFCGDPVKRYTPWSVGASASFWRPRVTRRLMTLPCQLGSAMQGAAAHPSHLRCSLIWLWLAGENPRMRCLQREVYVLFFFYMPTCSRRYCCTDSSTGVPRTCTHRSTPS